MKKPEWFLNLGRNRFEDFEEFKSDVTWFVKPDAQISVLKSSVNLNEDFKTTFPNLYYLIKRSRVLEVIINNIRYKLYSWDSKTGEPCGWLCKLEPADVSNLLISPEHQMLLDTIGGIKESYNEPDDAFTNNQNFLFIKSECEQGLGYSSTYYNDMCRNTAVVPLLENNLVMFVEEANGGRTLYDLSTKKVYLFSHDHCFDYVTFLEGQPKYTYHLINGVNTFQDYVETLAQQWAAHINF